MSAITTRIVEKYKLNPKMSESEYSSEFLKDLTDSEKKKQARRRLRDGFKFNIEQVGILIPNQRSGKNKTINIVEGSCRIAIASPPKNLEEEIIREIAKRILQNRYGFSEDQVNALFSIQKNGSVTTSDKKVNMCLGTSSAIAISNKPSKGIEEETIGDIVNE